MEELLKKLGFIYFTGPMWKHEKIGIITINDDDTTETLVQKIYERGYRECQVVIKSALNIKT